VWRARGPGGEGDLAGWYGSRVRLTVRRLDPELRDAVARRGDEANGSIDPPLVDPEAGDGYLLAADGDPACWCELGRRNGDSAGLSGDPDVPALRSFRVAPIYRHRQFAARLLEGVVADLREHGVRCVEAYPERGESLEHLELWDDDVFAAAGFEVVRDDPVRPVLRLEL
jgi:GNAT superfamily N-acetyltransferase